METMSRQLKSSIIMVEIATIRSSSKQRRINAKIFALKISAMPSDQNYAFYAHLLIYFFPNKFDFSLFQKFFSLIFYWLRILNIFWFHVECSRHHFRKKGRQPRAFIAIHDHLIFIWREAALRGKSLFLAYISPRCFPRSNKITNFDFLKIINSQTSREYF